MEDGLAESPLEDIVVLDLTDEDGDACGRLLGDLGADVIKVEPPGGSPARRRSWSGFTPDGRSYDWIASNINKRSVLLDLDEEGGRRAFKQMVANADCVVESFSPGYLGGIGLGYDDLRAINPRIVLTSISPFGQTGPYASFPATDLTIVAEGGVMATCGDADDAPLRMAYPQARSWAGTHAATSTLLALTDAEVHGRPHWVDVPMLLAAPWFMIASPDRSRASGHTSRRGTYRAMGAGHLPQILKCADGYVNYSINAGQIAAHAQGELVKWMDREGLCPDWLRTFDFAGWDGATTTAEFCTNFEAALLAFFATKTRAQLSEFALKNGLFLAPIRSMSEVINGAPFSDDPDLWWHIEGAGALPGTWIDMSETPIGLRRPPPAPGEHSAEVLRQLTDLSDDEIARLTARHGVTHAIER